MDPMIDHAAPILQAAQGIDDPTKADLHDIFHGSKDPDELARRVQAIGNVPPPVVQSLIAAKHSQMNQIEPTGDDTLDKGFKVIQRLGGLDQAESHPKIATALISLAAKTPEKEAGAVTGAPVASGRGKTAKNPQTSPETAPEPRPDGLPPLPPIPEGHKRLLATDGSIHDVPEENIEAARKIDPNMHVLNP